MTTPTGFLVALKVPEDRGERQIRLNPSYSGVDRVPVYESSFPEEQAAIEEYIFGNIKSEETNLIPDLPTALRLWKSLWPSPRPYELLLCCEGPAEPRIDALDPKDVEGLGYDVALVTGDCWSIVGDFAEGDWADAFLVRLNRHGLFADRADAEAYLQEYREHDEADADMDFDVVYVARLDAERLAASSRIGGP